LLIEMVKIEVKKEKWNKTVWTISLVSFMIINDLSQSMKFWNDETTKPELKFKYIDIKNVCEAHIIIWDKYRFHLTNWIGKKHVT
jgi:hypothetical protein